MVLRNFVSIRVRNIVMSELVNVYRTRRSKCRLRFPASYRYNCSVGKGGPRQLRIRKRGLVYRNFFSGYVGNPSKDIS